MTETLVDLYLPKFTMKETYDLNNNLNSLGMSSAFNSNADFSGMAEKGDLLISKVFHKSFVAVHEKGTEAAAATVMTIIISSCVSIPYEFRADHPFLFLIKHNPSKNILFFGRCCSP